MSPRPYSGGHTWFTDKDMKLYFTFSPQYESAVGGRVVDAHKEVPAMEQLWKKHGVSIIKSIEKTTRLRFQRESLDCYVNSKVSISSPLSIKIEGKNDMFDSLVHELIHQIIMQNFKKIEKPWNAHVRRSKKLGHTFIVWVHVVVHAIHYLVTMDVFGNEARLKRIVAYSKNKDYRKSWDVALERGPQTVVDQVFG